MPIITLMTDFGLSDTYVGQMKGVILGICPQATIVDLSHQVTRQDILAGALMLDAAVASFPAGTIHVAVVDPGVGSGRAAIACEAEDAFFVGPDNGLLSVAMKRKPLHRAVRLDNWRFFHHPVSHTFHGRDIFAPVAAHLARGVTLTELGPILPSVVTLDLPKPTRQGDGKLLLTVLGIDGFGNLVTNLTRAEYDSFITGQSDTLAKIQIRDAQVQGIHKTYSDVPSGQPLAYFGSSGRLEIAINHGHAARTYDVQPGQPLTLRRD